MASSTVNGAASPGSPATTAIFAPFGKTAGAGPQWRAVGLAVGAPCAQRLEARKARRHDGTARVRIGAPRAKGVVLKWSSGSKPGRGLLHSAFSARQLQALVSRSLLLFGGHRAGVVVYDLPTLGGLLKNKGHGTPKLSRSLLGGHSRSEGEDSHRPSWTKADDVN